MDHGIKNILVSGEPRVGKSFLLESIVLELGDKAGGIVTKEIQEKGERRGFEVVYLAGTRAVLAHADFKSEIMVGKYGVDARVLEEVIVPAIRLAIAENRIVVIDEIANMQLVSPAFCQAVLAALDSDCIVIATIHTAAHPFTDELKARSDVKVVHLSFENRDMAKEQILKELIRE